ncbi:hypothetical protein ACF0H5_013083 [Mactra antiquata]
MTAVESASLFESSLFCCCKCKGMFNCQDERLKHQINCIGNPFKTTCTYFACERKIFLQLFQPEDFLMDGCELPFTFSKDDSFIDHFVKIRVPDIFDPSIFLKSTAPTNNVDTDDSNFLLEPELSTLEDEGEKTPCPSYLESDKQVATCEDEQIQTIINKNIEYLKNSDLRSLSGGGSKVNTFQSSQCIPRLLSPVDRHLHLFGDGSKSRVNSPVERSSSFVQDSQTGYNFMYSSNPSIPLSCNFSTDLFSSTPPPTQEDSPAFLTNIEECPTLRYLDLAKKDPFFGQNLGLAQINTKDPFLINASVKTDRPTSSLQKSHITRSLEDIQASPTLQLQDGNYFNFPSTLDEPTQLDYLDLATLDFITNPNLVPSAPVLYKEKSIEKDDDIYRVPELYSEELMSYKTEPVSKAWSICDGLNARNDNAVIKNKKLRLKKSKSDVERRPYVCTLNPDKEHTIHFSDLKEDVQTENSELVDDVIAMCNNKERPKSETKDYKISRKRKLDSSKANGHSEIKPTKTHKRSGDTRRMSRSDIVFTPQEPVANIAVESNNSYNNVYGETGCIYVKKKRSLSCDEPVVYVNETNVFEDDGPFDDNTPSKRPNRIRTKSNSYVTGLSAVSFTEVSPNKAQRLTSIIKLKCPHCTFSCQNVADLKSHCVLHEATDQTLAMETHQTVSSVATKDIISSTDHMRSIMTVDKLSDVFCEGKSRRLPLLFSSNSTVIPCSSHTFKTITSTNVNTDRQTAANPLSSYKVTIPEFKARNNIIPSFDESVADVDPETELAVRAIANVACSDSFENLEDTNTTTLVSTSDNQYYNTSESDTYTELCDTSNETVKDSVTEDKFTVGVLDCTKPIETSQDIIPDDNTIENLSLEPDLRITSLSLYDIEGITENQESSIREPVVSMVTDPKSQIGETVESITKSLNDNDIDDDKSWPQNLFEKSDSDLVNQPAVTNHCEMDNTDNCLVDNSLDLNVTVDPIVVDTMPVERLKESEYMEEKSVNLLNDLSEDNVKTLVNNCEKPVIKDTEISCNIVKTVEENATESITEDHMTVPDVINHVSDADEHVTDRNDNVPNTEMTDSASKMFIATSSVISNSDKTEISSSEGEETNEPKENDIVIEGSVRTRDGDTISYQIKEAESQTKAVEVVEDKERFQKLVVHASKLVNVGCESKLKNVVKIFKLTKDKQPSTSNLNMNDFKVLDTSKDDIKVCKSSTIVVPLNKDLMKKKEVRGNTNTSRNDEQQTVTYYVCEEKGCNFKSIYKKNLTSHQKQIHLCRQQYLCDQCAFSTPHASSLKHHIQIKHLHEKKFKCPNCEYLSKFRLDVVKHVRHTHLKQKQFACNQCNYRTGHSHSLKLHLMAHAGIYCYKCSACDYRVGCMNKVSRHIKLKHVNQTGVKCEKLDVSFKIDIKEFLCDEKIPNDEIKVIELSPEEAIKLTEKQLIEKQMKSKPEDKKSTNSIEMKSKVSKQYVDVKKSTVLCNLEMKSKVVMKNVDILKGTTDNVDMKSKLPKLNIDNQKSNDSFGKSQSNVNHVIVMKRIIPTIENKE